MVYASYRAYVDAMKTGRVAVYEVEVSRDGYTTHSCSFGGEYSPELAAEAAAVSAADAQGGTDGEEWTATVRVAGEPDRVFVGTLSAEWSAYVKGSVKGCDDGE